MVIYTGKNVYLQFYKTSAEMELAYCQQKYSSSCVNANVAKIFNKRLEKIPNNGMLTLLRD